MNPTRWRAVLVKRSNELIHLFFSVELARSAYK